MPLWDYDNAPMTQLEVDTLNVYGLKTVELSSFPPEYAEKIKQKYRFAAHRYTSKRGLSAPLSPETMDAV
jgi:hypothetical protein